jgi:hypothetical protein
LRSSKEEKEAKRSSKPKKKKTGESYAGKRREKKRRWCSLYAAPFCPPLDMVGVNHHVHSTLRKERRPSENERKNKTRQKIYIYRKKRGVK